MQINFIPPFLSKLGLVLSFDLSYCYRRLAARWERERGGKPSLPTLASSGEFSQDSLMKTSVRPA